MPPSAPFSIDEIPQQCWNALYSILAVQEYNIVDGFAKDALVALGTAITAAAKQAEENNNPISDLHRALAAEADLASWCLQNDRDFPEPKAAELFLLFEEKPEDVDVIAIEAAARAVLTPGHENEPNYIVMVPGPLQEAVQALSPHRNPDPALALVVQ